jgi:hypothetical protein
VSDRIFMAGLTAVVASVEGRAQCPVPIVSYAKLCICSDK